MDDHATDEQIQAAQDEARKHIAELREDGMRQQGHLIDHGYTPRITSIHRPDGTEERFQAWDRQMPSSWPYVVFGIAVLIFSLFILKGVPW